MQKRHLLKENIFERYDKISKDYEECGIIKRFPSDDIPRDTGKAYYLSHRPVSFGDKESNKDQCSMHPAHVTVLLWTTVFILV